MSVSRGEGDVAPSGNLHLESAPVVASFRAFPFNGRAR